MSLIAHKSHVLPFKNMNEKLLPALECIICLTSVCKKVWVTQWDSQDMAQAGGGEDSSGKGRKGTILENNMWTATAGRLLSSMTPLGYTTLAAPSPLRPAQELPKEHRAELTSQDKVLQRTARHAFFCIPIMHSSFSIKCCFVCDLCNLVRSS